MRYRDATPADAEALARTVIDGFELYREFAPAGWEPATMAGQPADEREGWVGVSGPFPVASLGLDLVEYRSALRR